MDSPNKTNKLQRTAAYEDLARKCGVTVKNVKIWEKHFLRHLDKHCRGRKPKWCKDACFKFNIPSPNHRGNKTLRNPSHLVALLVSAAKHHQRLCKTAIFDQVRQHVRMQIPKGCLHEIWLRTQAVCKNQVLECSRRGDPCGAVPAAAAAVADLVLLHSEVAAERILTPDSAASCEESKALYLLWDLVKKYGIEDISLNDNNLKDFAKRWTKLWKDYRKSNREASLIVLQRRWHELKIQARNIALSFWRKKPIETYRQTNKHTTTQLSNNYKQLIEKQNSKENLPKDLNNISKEQTVEKLLITKKNGNYAVENTPNKENKINDKIKDKYVATTQNYIETIDKYVATTEHNNKTADIDIIPDSNSSDDEELDAHTTNKKDLEPAFIPAPLHLEIMKKYPKIVTAPMSSWQRMLEQEYIIIKPYDDGHNENDEEDDEVIDFNTAKDNKRGGQLRKRKKWDLFADIDEKDDSPLKPKRAKTHSVKETIDTNDTHTSKSILDESYHYEHCDGQEKGSDIEGDTQDINNESNRKGISNNNMQIIGTYKTKPNATIFTDNIDTKQNTVIQNDGINNKTTETASVIEINSTNVESETYISVDDENIEHSTDLIKIEQFIYKDFDEESIKIEDNDDLFEATDIEIINTRPNEQIQEFTKVNTTQETYTADLFNFNPVEIKKEVIFAAEDSEDYTVMSDSSKNKYDSGISENIVYIDSDDSQMSAVNSVVERVEIEKDSGDTIRSRDELKSSKDGKKSRVPKRVELPDIKEVRRVNSGLLTAQVAPISNQIAMEKLQSALKSYAELCLSSTEKRVKKPVAVEELPCYEILQRIILLLSNEMLVDTCCAARQNRYINDTRQRTGLPEVDIHKHDGSDCTCCCRHLYEPPASSDFRKELRILKKRISADLKIAEKHHQVRQQKKMVNNMKARKAKNELKDHYNNKKEKTKEQKTDNNKENNDNNNKKHNQVKYDKFNKEEHNSEDRNFKKLDKSNIITDKSATTVITNDTTLHKNNTTDSDLLSTPEDFEEWHRQKNINSLYFKPKQTSTPVQDNGKASKRLETSKSISPPDKTIPGDTNQVSNPSNNVNIDKKKQDEDDNNTPKKLPFKKRATTTTMDESNPISGEELARQKEISAQYFRLASAHVKSGVQSIGQNITDNNLPSTSAYQAGAPELTILLNKTILAANVVNASSNIEATSNNSLLASKNTHEVTKSIDRDIYSSVSNINPSTNDNVRNINANRGNRNMEYSSVPNENTTSTQDERITNVNQVKYSTYYKAVPNMDSGTNKNVIIPDPKPNSVASKSEINSSQEHNLHWNNSNNDIDLLLSQTWGSNVNTSTLQNQDEQVNASSSNFNYPTDNIDPETYDKLTNIGLMNGGTLTSDKNSFNNESVLNDEYLETYNYLNSIQLTAEENDIFNFENTVQFQPNMNQTTSNIPQLNQQENRTYYSSMFSGGQSSTTNDMPTEQLRTNTDEVEYADTEPMDSNVPQTNQNLAASELSNPLQHLELLLQQLPEHKSDNFLKQITNSNSHSYINNINFKSDRNAFLQQITNLKANVLGLNSNIQKQLQENVVCEQNLHKKSGQQLFSNENAQEEARYMRHNNISVLQRLSRPNDLLLPLPVPKQQEQNSVNKVHNTTNLDPQTLLNPNHSALHETRNSDYGTLLNANSESSQQMRFPNSKDFEQIPNPNPNRFVQQKNPYFSVLQQPSIPNSEVSGQQNLPTNFLRKETRTSSTDLLNKPIPESALQKILDNIKKIRDLPKRHEDQLLRKQPQNTSITNPGNSRIPNTNPEILQQRPNLSQGTLQQKPKPYPDILQQRLYSNPATLQQRSNPVQENLQDIIPNLNKVISPQKSSSNPGTLQQNENLDLRVDANRVPTYLHPRKRTAIVTCKNRVVDLTVEKTKTICVMTKDRLVKEIKRGIIAQRNYSTPWSMFLFRNNATERCLFALRPNSILLRFDACLKPFYKNGYLLVSGMNLKCKAPMFWTITQASKMERIRAYTDINNYGEEDRDYYVLTAIDAWVCSRGAARAARLYLLRLETGALHPLSMLPVAQEPDRGGPCRCQLMGSAVPLQVLVELGKALNLISDFPTSTQPRESYGNE